MPSATTVSGRHIAALYTPGDIAALDYARDLGDPGEFPYTRGIHPSGYRGKLWTMRQFAGFGTPEETNARYKQLLAGRRHRPERRVRSADADGARSGSRAVARRGGQVRRERDVARRHGGALQRHRSRRDHLVDDDQLTGLDDLRDVPGRGREAGRELADAVGHDPERHPQGVHRAEGIHLPAAPVDAADHRHLRLLRASRCRAGTRSR